MTLKRQLTGRDYVNAHGFRQTGASKRYLLALPVGWERMKSARDLEESRAVEIQLTNDEMRRYFLMMNFLKFRASRAKTEQQAGEFRKRAAEVREMLILANQRHVFFAVMSTIRRLRSSHQPDDLISAGQIVLIRCVDLFDGEGRASFASYVENSIRMRCLKDRCEHVAAIGRQFGEGEEFRVPSVKDDQRERAMDVPRAFRDAELTDKMIWTIEAHYGFSGPDMTKTEIASARGVNTNSVTNTLNAALTRLRAVVRKNRGAYVLKRGFPGQGRAQLRLPRSRY